MPRTAGRGRAPYERSEIGGARRVCLPRRSETETGACVFAVFARRLRRTKSATSDGVRSLALPTVAMRRLGEGGPGTKVAGHYACRVTRLNGSRLVVKVHNG